MSTTISLLNKLSQTQQNFSPQSARSSPKKISLQRSIAQQKYKKFSNLTKRQQLQQMRACLKMRNPQWRHEHYRANSTFSILQCQKKQLDEFPHNNKKYNTQFLQKTLQGGGLNFTARDNGYFIRPGDGLYSKHYVPIVKEKRKYNEDYLLRTSLFGNTWVDEKRDRVMDQYQIQANPFSTARSNQLICMIRPARKHRFS